jgi:Putative abortive phage resistance protein AbiGi, antitoxin
MDYFIDDKRRYPAEERSLPLIHMTDQFETLKKIILEGLRPSYCEEYLTNNDRTIYAAFPMISLSNITVNEAIHHQKSYGTYGIALKKAWGQRNGFNPVFYFDRHSDLANEIIGCFEYIKNYGFRHQLTHSCMKFFAHSKNYDGQLIRKNHRNNLENYSFGLEREWRKIVTQEDTPDHLKKEAFDTKEELNKRISEHKCNFDLDEIDCIIVESYEQRQVIQNLLLEKYNQVSREDLVIINSIRHYPDEG